MDAIDGRYSLAYRYRTFMGRIHGPFDVIITSCLLISMLTLSRLKLSLRLGAVPWSTMKRLRYQSLKEKTAPSPNSVGSIFDVDAASEFIRTLETCIGLQMCCRYDGCASDGYKALGIIIQRAPDFIVMTRVYAIFFNGGKWKSVDDDDREISLLSDRY